MNQLFTKLLKYFFDTTKHSDLDFNRFQQLESKKSIRKDRSYV